VDSLLSFAGYVCHRISQISLAVCAALVVAPYSSAAQIQFLCKFELADGSSPSIYLIDGPSEENKIREIAYAGEIYLSRYVNVSTDYMAQGTLIGRVGIYVFLEENMSDNYFSVTIFKGIPTKNAIYSFSAVDGHFSALLDPAPRSLDQTRGHCQELLQ